MTTCLAVLAVSCLFLKNAIANQMHIDPLLWDQNLNDFNFHTTCVRKELMRAACANMNCSAVVVGVESGVDLLAMAEAGFYTIGIEPMPHYAKAVTKAAINQDVLSKVNIIQGAASSRTEEVVINYNGRTLTSQGFALDLLIKEEVAVLSVDVHGDATPLEVLRGAQGALSKGLVRSLWVEIKALDWAAGVLELLRDDYILFDFIWSGSSKKCVEEDLPPHICPHRTSYEGARPSDESYLDEMLNTLRRDFQWLQTDIVAFHRSYFSEDIRDYLSSIGQRCA